MFLLDASRSGTARWCSMATCGNRLKARRHHARGKDPHA
jgi:predicted RNA-binding Zn ribbon-like protein